MCRCRQKNEVEIESLGSVYKPCKEYYSENCKPTRNSYVEQLKWKTRLGIRSRESDWKGTHKRTFSYNIPCDCDRGYVGIQQADYLSRQKIRHILKEGLLGKSKLAQQTCEEDYRMSWSKARILSIEEQVELKEGTGHILPAKTGYFSMWVPLRGNASIQHGRRVNAW
jgi:hypothetical protein